MSNKKIDIYMRFTLYFLPIIFICFECWLSHKGTGTIETLQQFYELICDGLDWANTLFFTSFTNWVHTNIASTNACLDSILYYVYYIVFVEMFILFKNVLTFLFKVANDWLQKGVNIAN